MALHSFNILSICSGVGGLELGLRLAVPNSRVICYVEGEAYATAVLAERMAENTLDSAPVWSDLRTFDGQPWRGKVDCLAGGYPCQPFSFAGKRQGENDPRHLWPVVASIIRDVQPTICFFENVRGHLSLGFEEVARELSGMGYAVKAGLFSAAEVGASHNRERLFILAYNNGDGRIQNNKKRNDKSIFQDGTQSQFRACEGYKYVANSSSERGKWRMLQRTCKQKCEEEIDERNYALGIPVWPPMPNDRQAWSEIPDNLKPSVLRVADGLANRLDRIRACGNGVVPLVAAYIKNNL